uniref:carbohydrate ABC transporter permease n=1 Tax=Parolsenella massiliensis TaxID=1871022 RepID=UPI0009FA6B79|nr:sugar ABC transporter permease [Parolsenella massiliensis]
METSIAATPGKTTGHAGAGKASGNSSESRAGERLNAKKVLRALRPYAAIAPSIVILAAFWIYPIFEMGGLSLCEWNLVNPEKVFVGLQNYVTLFQDAQFRQTLVSTLIYMVFTVGLSVVLGMLCALHLKRASRRNRFLQAVIFSPYVISLASISLLWLWIMNRDYGLLNQILSVFGVSPVDWLGDARVALASLIAISVWKSVGYDALILTSALQSVPENLYEAAELDHAKPWATFWKITLPIVSPTLFFLVIVEVISSLKVFETIQIMTQGGPQNATNTIVFSLYQYAFKFYKVGYAAAIGMVLLVLVAIFAVIYFKVLEKRVHYR